MQKKLLVAVLGTLFALPALADTAPTTSPATAPAAAPAAAPEAAAAPAPVVTSNVALVTNYLYRGLTQSGGNPAVQGGFDYTPASGFYIGAWGSSISWLSDQGSTQGSSGLELDTYLGYRNSFATDYSYDVGYLRYNYPGHYAQGATKGDTDEIYALIGYKWITAKYSYALGNTFGTANTTGSNYFDLSASYAIGDSGYTVGAHYGIQTYTGTGSSVVINGTSDSLTYSDYRVSVTKDLTNGFAAGLTWSSTNANDAWTNGQGYKEGQSVVVASLSRTL
jgi:uncharacterized protein (TIGR02001 family)